MAVDISKLGVDELARLQNEVESQLQQKKAEKKKQVIQKVKDILFSNGMTMDDLTGRTTTRAKVAPKYRNPQDSNQTWTGRGRQPLWVAEFLSKGGKMDAITIK